MYRGDDLWYWKDPKTKACHISKARDCLDNTPARLLKRFVHSSDEMYTDESYIWRPICMINHY